MNGNSVQNVTNVYGSPGIGLNISSAGGEVMKIAYNDTETDVLRNITEIGLENNLIAFQVLSPDRITTIGTMSYSTLTGLTLDLASQDITNKTGTTYSNNFYLTGINEGGTGGITFADNTVQTTASVGGGNAWSTFPATQAVDLDGNDINRASFVKGNGDITIIAGYTDSTESSTLAMTNNGYADTGTYSSLYLRPVGVELRVGDFATSTTKSATFDTAGLLVVPSIRTISLDMNDSKIQNVAEVASAEYLSLSANSLVNHTGIIDIYTNWTEGGTNDVPASEFYLNNDGASLYTYPNGYDGAYKQATLGMDGVFTVPKLNISGANSEIAFANGSGFIKGEGLTIGTPTNTTFILQTNLNANFGDQFSQILMDNTGFRFITGLLDSTATESYYDNTGLWTFPSAKINSGLDMNGGTITKCNGIKSDGNLNIFAGETSTTSQINITTCANPPDNTPYSQINIYPTEIQIIPADNVDSNHPTTFKQNGDVELYSNLKVGVGGAITFADATVQSSGLIKGTRTLAAGTVTITDSLITTGAICIATYAASPPVGGVLCAIVTAGQIVIQSSLITDTSPIFFMYFI